MTAPFRLDEQVTIEQRVATGDADFGGPVDGDAGWEVVATDLWANAQDILPSRGGETGSNGLLATITRTRLRLRINDQIATGMRVTLHGRGDRLMLVIAGPALLDDRRHAEFMLEAFSS
jgi:hypothetical protein